MRVELCSLPAIYLGPNCGGGDEGNGDLLQKIPGMSCHTQCPQACSRPPLTHASAETPGHSQASLGQSLVGSPLLSPGSLCTKFCLCPPRVYFQVLCKFWQLCGGVNGDLLHVALCHTQACCTQSSCPCDPYSTADAQAQFSLSLCGVPGSWRTRFVWVLLASLAGIGFDSKREFAPPTVLLAQRLKRLPAMQETRVWSLGWEDALEKEMATDSSILAWRIPWREEPGRLQSVGSQSQTRLSNFTSPSCWGFSFALVLAGSPLSCWLLQRCPA